jgi:hypothetical protein
MDNLAPHHWLELKPSTRTVLTKIFRINRSSFTHVVDNKVETDGYTYDDLKAISVPEMKLITHLDSNDFEEQFKIIINMVENKGSAVENAINNGQESKQILGSTTHAYFASGENKSSVSSGTRSQTQENNSQGQALSVPGGSVELDRGRDEFVSGNGNGGQASMAEQDAKVDTKEPKASGNAGQKRPGVQKV